MDAFTTDTTVAVDAFIEGATVTTPTAVVATTAVEEQLEVVIVARAAIAPEPLTAVKDVVPEDLEVLVAPDVVDLITGATTAVTTVAVVLEVLDPNPLPEPTELDIVFPTAATTDVDVPTTDEPRTRDPDDCTTDGPAEDWIMLDETTAVLVVVEDEEEKTLSTPEVLTSVETGPIIP